MTPGEVVKAIVKNPLTDGVTFSGGEPMDQAEALIPIASALRGKGYNLWLYTGYTWEALSAVQRELAGLTDVVIDGRFILEERTLELPWRGSRNQRLIDAQKSTGGVVLWEPSFPA
jgi:anaerobic ribonucleoside-triphosphate reductase activating protein